MAKAGAWATVARAWAMVQAWVRTMVAIWVDQWQWSNGNGMSSWKTGELYMAAGLRLPSVTHARRGPTTMQWIVMATRHTRRPTRHDAGVAHRRRAGTTIASSMTSSGRLRVSAVESPAWGMDVGGETNRTLAHRLLADPAITSRTTDVGDAARIDAQSNHGGDDNHRTRPRRRTSFRSFRWRRNVLQPGWRTQPHMPICGKR